MRGPQQGWECGEHLEAAELACTSKAAWTRASSRAEGLRGVAPSTWGFSLFQGPCCWFGAPGLNLRSRLHCCLSFRLVGGRPTTFVGRPTYLQGHMSDPASSCPPGPCFFMVRLGQEWETLPFGRPFLDWSGLLCFLPSANAYWNTTPPPTAISV